MNQHLMQDGVFMSTQAKEKQPKVIMYSKDPCPYCDRARNFFEARDIVFEEIDLTGQDEEILAQKQKWGWATVPIIIINEKLVGGYNDLKALDQAGELEKILGR